MVSAALLTLVLGIGAVAALATVALGSAIAAVFGLGWGVVVVAGGVLVAGVVVMRTEHPAWFVLPVAALVLPAAVMIGLHAHLNRQIGDVSVVPADRSAIRDSGYRSGLGDILIDLRHYRFTPGSTTPVHVDAGLGRTVVALPHTECVAVRVVYSTHSSVLDAAARLVGVDNDGSPTVSVFGRPYAGGSGQASDAVHRGRPTVVVDFRSQGGVLVVRDYPDSVDPREDSGWPGETYDLGPRPRVTSRHGARAREQRAALGSWRASLREEQRIARQKPGPCGKRRPR